MQRKDSLRANHPLAILAWVYLLLGLGMLALAAILAAVLPDFVLSSDWPALLAPVIVGVVFFCVGLGLALVMRRKRRIREDLLLNGERIEAEIVCLEADPNISINGRSRMGQRLVCRYTEDGVTYTCRSDYLRGYPVISAKTVTVLRDRYDKRRYLVEVESALKPTVEL